MQRRDFLRLAALGGVATMAMPNPPSAGAASAARPKRRAVTPFELDEITLRELAARQAAGELSAVSIVKKYWRRVAEIDRGGPAVNAILELNPDAPALAAALDRERRARGPRGPLHGVPILIKDNLDTHDRMTTTAGSLALAGSIPPRDSFVAAKLREAGAILLGKTNLSEWANFRSTRSTSGWSGRGGQTRNPYVLDRNPSGSSSGSGAAVAANLCAAAVGTETDGSILSPSSFNGIVGIKPTLGLVSRAGIIPIAQSQDTAGPMARTVTDAAILLGVMAGVDPRDPATAASAGQASPDYTKSLVPGDLRGVRLGVARGLFTPSAAANRVVEEGVAALKQLGAEIIDPVEFPNLEPLGAAESTVLRFEFKAGINAYLATLGPASPMRTLRDLIEFNERHRNEEMPWFDQEEFLASEAKGPLTDQVYLDALAQCLRYSRKEGIDGAMDQHRLDAILAPTTGPAHVTDYLYGDRDTGGTTSLAAVAGYPSITVPAGNVLELPVGLSFFGRAWSEPMLLRVAYAFEQTTRARRTPRFLPTVER